MEKKVKHPYYRYVGTFDILADIDNSFALVDIKTSAAVYDDYRLQQPLIYLLLMKSRGYWVVGIKKLSCPEKLRKDTF